MDSLRSILVDVDSTASAHPALERALHLARRSGARLTIVDVLTVPPSAHVYLPPGIEQSLVHDRSEHLAQVASAARDVGVEAKLLIGRPGTALIEEVLGSHHDLLVRSHAREFTASGAKPFGAVDLELLRKCPCPVLLVRHGPPVARPRIACALDASSDDAEMHALNTKIVRSALVLAECLESDVPLLFHAWVPFAERTVRSRLADAEFEAYLGNVRERAASAIAAVARSFEGRFGERHVAIRRGAPEDVIPEFVVSQGIDILVMGTVARGGLRGFLIGNTAERVLRKLPCSVLTVKPDGFVSPVRLESE